MTSQPARLLSLEVLETLRDAGYEAYWAGGCVRDLLLGETPDDFDVATDATPRQVQELFGKRRTLAVGAAFGVIIVLGRRLPQGEVPQVEVATFRADGSYSDGRRPDEVIYSSAEVDAQRRDFTINALFLNPLDSSAALEDTPPGNDTLRAAVIDYIGGLDDLTARQLRAVGNPTQRFEEDKLRLLRAVRFVQRLGDSHGFVLESQTRRAIRESAAAITVVSWERITQELSKMLRHPARSRGFEMLVEFELFEPLFPELTRDAAASLESLPAVPHDEIASTWSLEVALAMLLRSLDDSRITTVARRMTLSNRQRDDVLWLKRAAAAMRTPIAKVSPADWKPVLAEDRSLAAIWLAHGIARDEGRSPEAVEQWHARRAACDAVELDPPLLLTGADLLAAGYKSGPLFKDVLGTLRREQLEGVTTTREQALEALPRLVANATPAPPR